MKKIFTCILAAMLAMPLFATVLLTESFDYTYSSSPVNALSSVSNSNWTQGTGTSTNLYVAENSLIMANYCPEATGKSVQYSSGSCINYRTFESINTGALYMSALINLKSVASGKVGPIFALGSGNASSKQYGRVIAKTVEGGYQLGIAKYTESTTYMRYSRTLELDKTYLVVVRYDFVAGEKNDEAYLWIDPISTSENTPTVKFTQDTTSSIGNPLGAFKCEDPTSLSYIQLQSGSNQPTSMILDEIKVATTWADLGISDGDEPVVKPELGVSTNSLDFGKYVSGQSYTKTFTVTAANLTEDISIGFKSPLSNITVSPTTIAKDNADLATGVTVTVTVEEDKRYDFTGTVVISSGSLTKNVSISGTEQVITYKNIASFASLLEETETDDVIYTYTGTAAKILSVDEEYKQIVLKDTKSVKVQISDADWAANTYVEGMKVTQFVFTAEILLGGTSAICTPITLTFAAPNFTREITSTDLATICLKGDVSNFAKLQEQATFYKILCKQEYQGEVYNIVLEEVNTNMEAGKPYIFQPKAPCTMEFYYSATTDFAGSENGLIGTFTNIESAVDNILVGKYLISNNMFCKAGEYCSLAANRAYIDIDQVPAEENAAPKVGMRHINLQNADARQLPTNLNETQTHNSVRKAIINGQFVILHNNKAFNAIGAEIQ